MSKKRRQLTGHPVPDQRGNPTWEWLTEKESIDQDIDTTLVKAYGDALSRHGGVNQDWSGVDPYNKTIPARQGSSAKPKRRTLDDMRRLDKQIKAARRK